MQIIEKQNKKIDENSLLIRQIRTKTVCCTPAFVVCKIHRMGALPTKKIEAPIDSSRPAIKFVPFIEQANGDVEMPSGEVVKKHASPIASYYPVAAPQEEEKVEEPAQIILEVEEPAQLAPEVEEQQGVDAPRFTHDQLAGLSVKGLVMFCKQHDIKGYSTYKKRDDLVMFIVEGKGPVRAPAKKAPVAIEGPLPSTTAELEKLKITELKMVCKMYGFKGYSTQCKRKDQFITYIMERI